MWECERGDGGASSGFGGLAFSLELGELSLLVERVGWWGLEIGALGNQLWGLLFVCR
jgi:hypothetical protein